MLTRRFSLLESATVSSVLIAIGAVGGSGCAHEKQTQQPPMQVVIEPDESLGVDDVFEVRVSGEPDLTGLFRVTADGDVDFPYVGRFVVLGKRSGDVQRLIAGRLKEGQILRNPQVTVMVKEWNSRKISVLGQVQKPGSVSYFPKMTIVDAIAAAGGFTGIAAKNKVTLRREVDGRVESRAYPVDDIAEGKGVNVQLIPGDVLVVGERLF